MVFCTLLLQAKAGIGAQSNTGQALTQTPDTLIEDIEKEDAIIEEIIKTKKTPGKEKVQYFSQLTQYGFKNLFTNYGYNSALPYSSQVNPNAEELYAGLPESTCSSLQKMKSWGIPYFNLIDNIFAQYGLPRELKYFAVIESNLNTCSNKLGGRRRPLAVYALYSTGLWPCCKYSY